nr:uncharacterized protein LOC125424319 isoform X1 [Ziziphus jujuba var. spinosa]
MRGNSKAYIVSNYKLLEEVEYVASATGYRAIYLPSNEAVDVKCLDLDHPNRQSYEDDIGIGKERGGLCYLEGTRHLPSEHGHGFQVAQGMSDKGNGRLPARHWRS